MRDFTSIEAQGRDTLQCETMHSARTTQSLALCAFGARKAVRYWKREHGWVASEAIPAACT